VNDQLSTEWSRLVILWGCGNGVVIAVGAILLFSQSPRADAGELFLLGLLIGVEVAALSLALGILLRVLGGARRRKDAVAHGGARA
jgi:hypothetical protein